MVSNVLAALLTTPSLDQLPIFDLEQFNLQLNLELIISLDGDGTFLETIYYLKDYSIPVLGIHTGDLGFLTRVIHREAIARLVAFFEGRLYLRRADTFSCIWFRSSYFLCS